MIVENRRRENIQHAEWSLHRKSGTLFLVKNFPILPIVESLVYFFLNYSSC